METNEQLQAEFQTMLRRIVKKMPKRQRESLLENPMVLKVVLVSVAAALEYAESHPIDALDTLAALKHRGRHTEGFVSENNGTQTIQLPHEARFPAGVKQVHVRLVGCDRILSPIERTWDSFFLSDDNVTDDFMTERLGGSRCE